MGFTIVKTNGTNQKINAKKTQNKNSQINIKKIKKIILKQLQKTAK